MFFVWEIPNKGIKQTITVILRVRIFIILITANERIVNTRSRGLLFLALRWGGPVVGVSGVMQRYLIRVVSV